jgi:hypothetical protein
VQDILDCITKPQLIFALWNFRCGATKKPLDFLKSLLYNV